MSDESFYSYTGSPFPLPRFSSANIKGVFSSLRSARGKCLTFCISLVELSVCNKASWDYQQT